MIGFFTLGVASVGESVGTRVVGMRSLMSCMTRNIPYRPLHVHFRWGVALIGEFFYWALIIPLWDPLSGTGGVQGDSVPTRL